jgi:hypothetical protein
MPRIEATIVTRDTLATYLIAEPPYADPKPSRGGVDRNSGNAITARLVYRRIEVYRKLALLKLEEWVEGEK